MKMGILKIHKKKCFEISSSCALNSPSEFYLPCLYGGSTMLNLWCVTLTKCCVTDNKKKSIIRTCIKHKSCTFTFFKLRNVFHYACPGIHETTNFLVPITINFDWPSSFFPITLLFKYKTLHSVIFHQKITFTFYLQKSVGFRLIVPIGRCQWTTSLGGVARGRVSCIINAHLWRARYRTHAGDVTRLLITRRSRWHE